METQHEVTFGTLEAPKLCGNCNGATKEPYIFCYQCKKNSPASVICLRSWIDGREWVVKTVSSAVVAICNFGRSGISIGEGGLSIGEEMGGLAALVKCGPLQWPSSKSENMAKRPMTSEGLPSFYSRFFLEHQGDNLNSISNGGGEAAVARTQVMVFWLVLTRASRGVEPRDRRFDGMTGLGRARSSFSTSFSYHTKYFLYCSCPGTILNHIEKWQEKIDLSAKLQVKFLYMYRSAMGIRYNEGRKCINHDFIFEYKCMISGCFKHQLTIIMLHFFSKLF
ncbi:unnamed protein product, partial [Meganyctiphanes norvegica]